MSIRSKKALRGFSQGFSIGYYSSSNHFHKATNVYSNSYLLLLYGKL
ncbi:hypothetical protein HMPREF1869_01202 [Bacteroidales bacterium KA00251]|nr:hypothetical protein HMPREF1869_01202 [Bacteroidales bacterium KA00251]